MREIRLVCATVSITAVLIVVLITVFREQENSTESVDAIKRPGVSDDYSGLHPRLPPKNVLDGVATMPEAMYDRLVKDMVVGEGGWVTSLAVEVLPKGHCFLRSQSTVYPEATESAIIYIKRRENGFFTDISQVSEKWTPITKPASYDLPIVELKVR